ncbi:ERF family protein [Serratia quinivorans]
MNSAQLPELATLLGSISHLINGMTPPMENNKPVCPVINNAPAEPVAPAAAPQQQFKPTLPDESFANVEEAFLSIYNLVNNPRRDEYNEDLDFTYASLPQILDALRPILFSAGMYMTQNPTKNADGEHEIVTEFCHARSQTSKRFVMPMLMKKDRRLDACQEYGATITYSRRYHILSIFSISADLDDADQAEAKKERRREKRAVEQRLNQREWLPSTSERTKEESILNVLVANGDVKDPALIAQAKAKNIALITPDEEVFISKVVADPVSRDKVQRIADNLLAERRATGEPLPQYSATEVYRQIWLEACKVVAADNIQDPIEAKRDERRRKIINGEIDTHADEETERLIQLAMSAEHPMPPFPEHERSTQPTVDLADEHTVLMRQKVILCQEIATGDGTEEEKLRLIRQVRSRADFTSAAEIDLIIEGVINSGKPASPIAEDDIPY